MATRLRLPCKTGDDGELATCGDCKGGVTVRRIIGNDLGRELATLEGEQGGDSERERTEKMRRGKGGEGDEGGSQ